MGLRFLLLAGQGVPGLMAAARESGARAWLLLHPGNHPGSKGAAQQRGLRRAHARLQEGLERLHHPARATGESQAKVGCLGWGTEPCWGAGPGANQNQRLTGHLWVKTGACLLLRVPQNREARKRGEGGGVGKKRERKKKMKEGKRQENPNSHPGRDLKGQRQLSAPPSRTPKTSLLSSPHWHLSAAQTHTQEALLRVRSSPHPCLPRRSAVRRAGECMGPAGAASRSHAQSCIPAKLSTILPELLLQQTRPAVRGGTEPRGPRDPNVLCHCTTL